MTQRFNKIGPLEIGCLLARVSRYGDQSISLFDDSGESVVYDVEEARAIHEWLGRALAVTESEG